jgi:phage N-6-adenine-methyltransferase
VDGDVAPRTRRRRNPAPELPLVEIQRGGGLPADPRRFREQEAKVNAIIQFAARVRDWPLLGDAVDAKIEDQREFVRWWDEAVRVGQSPGINQHKRSVSVSETNLSVEQAFELTEIGKVQVSRWRKSIGNVAKYREQLIVAARRKADLSAAANHRAEGTGDNEWFTPAQYVEAARAVMGEIDLDPATHASAQQTVGAISHFTAADNGLVRPWHGRVWLNPPYVQPLIAQFVEKLVVEVNAQRVDQAILLTHNYTDTAWFHQAEAAADLLCFTRGRIKFVDVDGDDCAPTQGQAFFYYGPAVERFRETFLQFGFVR